MINKTPEELEALARRLWPEGFRVERYLKLAGNKLTVSASYEPPPMGLKELVAIKEFFGVADVADGNSISHGGCETCDYGSEYGNEYTLVD